MKRGVAAIVLILILVIAAIALFVLYKTLSTPSGAAQYYQPVIFPGEQQIVKPQCCRTGTALYDPRAHVKVTKCSAAYGQAIDTVLKECPAELKKPIDSASCKSKNILWENNCQVEICCTY